MRRSSIFKKIFLLGVASLGINFSLAASNEAELEKFLRSKLNDPTYLTRSSKEIIQDALRALVTQSSSDTLTLTLWSAASGLGFVFTDETPGSGTSTTDSTNIDVIAFSPLGRFIALADSTNNQVVIEAGSHLYHTSGITEKDAKAKLQLWPNTIDIKAMAWSPMHDGEISYLAVAGTSASSNGAKELKIFPWDHSLDLTDTITISAPLVMPELSTNAAVSISSVAWSPNRSYTNYPANTRYLAIVHDDGTPGTVRLSIIQIKDGVVGKSGGSFIVKSATAITGQSTTTAPIVTWHPTGKFLAVSYNNVGGTIGNIQFYKFDPDKLVLDNPGTTPLAGGTSLISLATGAASTDTVITDIEFSPDGQFLLAVGRETKIPYVKIIGFDPINETISQTIGAGGKYAQVQAALAQANTFGATSAKWSPDGKFIAVGTVALTNGYSKLFTFSFDITTSTLSAVTPVATEPFSVLSTDLIKSVDWSPDGGYIAVGGSQTTTTGLLKDSIKLQGELNDAKDELITINNTAVEPYLIPARVYKVNYNAPGVEGFIPDTSPFISGLLGNEKLDLWSGSEGTDLVSRKNSPLSLDTALTATAMTWSPDSKYVAIAFARRKATLTDTIIDDTAYLYISDLHANDVTRNDNFGYAAYGENGDRITSMSWSKENAEGSSFIAVGGKGLVPTGTAILATKRAKLKVFKFADGALDTNPANILYPLDLFVDLNITPTVIHEQITSVAWSPNGQYLAALYNTTGRRNYQLAIFPFDGASFGAPIRSEVFQSKNGAKSLSWHPNSKYIAFAQNGDFLSDTNYKVVVYKFDGVGMSRFSSEFVTRGGFATPPIPPASPARTRSVITGINTVSFNPDGTYIAVGTATNGDSTTIAAGGARVAMFQFSSQSGLAFPDSTALVHELDNSSTQGHVEINTIAWSPDGTTFTAGGRTAGGENNKLYIFRWLPTSEDEKIKALSPDKSERYSDNVNDSIDFNVWSPNGSYIAMGGNMINGSTVKDLTLLLDDEVIGLGSKLPFRIYNTGLQPGGINNVAADSTTFTSIVDFGNNDLFYGTKDGYLWFRRSRNTSDSTDNDFGTPNDAWVQISGVPKGSLTSVNSFTFVIRRNLDGKLYVIDRAGVVHKSTSTGTKLKNVNAGTQLSFQRAADINQLGLPVFKKLGQAGNSLFAITADGRIYDYQDTSKTWKLVSYPTVSAFGKLIVNNNLAFNI